MTKLTVKDLLDMEAKVLQWNVVGGNSLDDETLIPTYTKLCIEELEEYNLAMEENDLPEQLDAICDSIFVGFMLNRLKEGEGYLQPWLNYSSFIGHTKISSNVILEKLGHEDDVLYYTTQLPIWVLQNKNRFDIKSAFSRVCESNYSKYIHKDVDVDFDAEFVRILEQGRYHGLFTEQVGDYFVIKAFHDSKNGVTFDGGKIMKPSMFKSVEDLGGLGEFILD